MFENCKSLLQLTEDNNYNNINDSKEVELFNNTSLISKEESINFYKGLQSKNNIKDLMEYSVNPNLNLNISEIDNAEEIGNYYSNNLYNKINLNYNEYIN